MLHCVHFHTERSRQVVARQLVSMQITVGDEYFRIVVIHLLNDGRNREIEPPCNVVSALTGNYLIAAAFLGTGYDRVFDPVHLNGFFKLLVIFALTVNRKIVEFGFFQIAGVKNNKVCFPVFRHRQSLDVLLTRRIELVFKNLGNGHTCRACGSGTGRRVYRIFLCRFLRLLGSGFLLFRLFVLGSFGRSSSGSGGCCTLSLISGGAVRFFNGLILLFRYCGSLFFRLCVTFFKALYKGFKRLRRTAV